MPSRLALVPGTFDPVTNGHVDIIERASRLFGRVLVAVAEDTPKSALFGVAERIAMLKEVCSGFANVEVEKFGGLLVDYAAARGADVIVRGLRVVSDFEYELQMAHANRRLNAHIETVFVMTTADYSFLSSSIVKEIARLGGSVEGLVPDRVRERLEQKPHR